MPARGDSKKKNGKSSSGGGKDLWDYIGQALVDSSPGKVFAVNASADIEKKKLQNQYATDPNVIAAQQATLDQAVGVYDKMHSSASEAGSAILGMFTGGKVKSQSERDIALLEAQTAAAAAASGALPAAPPPQLPPKEEEDNTLLYGGLALGAVVLVGGAIALASSSKAAA